LLIDAQRRGIKIIVVTHDVGQARRLARVSFCTTAASSNNRQPNAFSISRKATRPARSLLAAWCFE
jgi:ABC-type polar amino acid transport system ATPase subunit